MRWSDSHLVLPSECGGEELISRFLSFRGFSVGVDQENFLRPRLASLAAPEELPGISDGVEFLSEAIQGKKRILIFSDYDVDGIVSATLMKLFLQSQGSGEIRTFLPDRQKEGYGLTMEALDRALGQGFVPEVFLALDCGTNSFGEVEKLKQAGVRVLIVVRRLAKTVHPGLKRLMEVSGVGQRVPTSFTLGFQLGPRINAGGRVGDASSGLELLLSHDPTETARLARELDLQNRKRQELEAVALGEAEKQVESLPKGLANVVASDRWHPGVVGIVAARLVRKFHRPSFTIALNSEGEGRGSGRGLPGLSLMDALRACSSCLKGFGGHDAAAGIVIQAGQVAEFRKLLQAWLETHVAPDIFEKTLPIDIQLCPSHLTPEMARALAELAPFGKGNPEPILRVDGVQVVGTPRIFAERHLKFRAQAGDKKFEVIGFDFAKRVPTQRVFDLAGIWEWDDYTDGPRWRMTDWQ